VAPAATLSIATAVSTTSVPPGTSVSAPPPTTSAPPPVTSAPLPTATTTAVPVTTTADLRIHVTTPGTYDGDEFVIGIAFVSEVDDVSSAGLEAAAIETLNSPAGWNRSGFFFVGDEGSDLTVVLADGPRVDELCDPLETGGRVSCQNGPIVALNADRWRDAFDGWTGTVEEYRKYLVTHEVGHLVGLRHPRDRCPTADRIGAVMEPQTDNLRGCIGNWIPLEWEIEWARSRPVVVGPAPDWEGPRPEWPTS
jgi:hypothetical protein